MAETVILIFILMQITTLASQTRHDNSDSAHQQLTLSSNSPDIYALATHITDRNVLEKLAEQEAQRIIATGDIASLQTLIEQNSTLFGLMSY